MEIKVGDRVDCNGCVGKVKTIVGNLVIVQGIWYDYVDEGLNVPEPYTMDFYKEELSYNEKYKLWEEKMPS